jgi:translocation protein SEC63
MHLCCRRRYVGANQMMEETLALFLDPRYGIKESQALSRIPETLVCAMEFITLPSPAVRGRQRVMAADPACRVLGSLRQI